MSDDPAGGQTLQVVSRADDYLPTIAAALAAMSAPCDLVIYNAGMDRHEHSAIGGLRGVTRETLAERERLVFAWARGRGIRHGDHQYRADSRRPADARESD